MPTPTAVLPVAMPTIQKPSSRPTRAPTATSSKPALQTPRWFDDVVLYEIFPRSFYDSNGDGIGDLKGITSKLDYLKDLGIGAVWLTPIFASPSYHGYDTTDYYKIHPDFGTEVDLVELVREAHKRNIRVLLDYVVAHTSNQHPFFKDALGNLNSKYADWYRWSDKAHLTYESFRGVKEMPTLNHDNPEVQQYLIDIAKYWMEKSGSGNPKEGIDGYRCDYVLNVPHALWKKLRAELKAVRPDFLLLAEAWTRMLDIAEYYDDEFDATFDFPLYGDIEGSHDRIGDSLLLGVTSPDLLASTLAVQTRLFPPGAQSVRFINNHDTNRVMSEVKGDIRRAKLGATLLLTLPSTPMVYYGEEIGMAGTKGPAPDYDQTRREPMEWYAAETGPGMTTWYRPGNRNNQPHDGISVEEQQGKAGSLLEHYRALIALRNTHAALRTGRFEKVALDGGDKVAAFLRLNVGESFVVVLNFDDQPAAVTLDLASASLPDGRFTVTDALTGKSLPDLQGMTYTLLVEPVGGYVLQLVGR